MVCVSATVEAWSKSQISRLAWDDVGVRVSRRTGHFLSAVVLRWSNYSAVSALANGGPCSVHCWREALSAVGSRCCEFLSAAPFRLQCDETVLSRLPCHGSWSRLSCNEAALSRLPYDEAWSRHQCTLCLSRVREVSFSRFAGG
jgi:hypothetical protein